MQQVPPAAHLLYPRQSALIRVQDRPWSAIKPHGFGQKGSIDVSRSPKFISEVDECVTAILEHANGDLRLGAPLGLGKPNVLLNALYACAERDPALRLTLFTALSLERPRAKNDLERRFLQPFLDRHFGADYPDLAYVKALHAGKLPANVCVHEFYLQSGTMLGVAAVQRNYISINYTHVARDMHSAGLNAFTQLLAVRDEGGTRHFSLSACSSPTSIAQNGESQRISLVLEFNSSGVCAHDRATCRKGTIPFRALLSRLGSNSVAASLGGNQTLSSDLDQQPNNVRI